MKNILLIVSLAAACGRTAHDSQSASLQVRDAWARGADSGAVTAVYLVVVNAESAPATLLAASSPLAEQVALHETMQMDGMVHMMPLDAPQAIAAGDSLVLGEGAKHFMVTGLKRKVAAGDSLPLVLSFAGGRTLPVRAVVRAP